MKVDYTVGSATDLRVVGLFWLPLPARQPADLCRRCAWSVGQESSGVVSVLWLADMSGSFVSSCVLFWSLVSWRRSV